MVERGHQDLCFAAYKSFELSPLIGGMLGILAGRSFLEKLLGGIAGYLGGSVVKYIGQQVVFDRATSARALIRIDGEVFKLKPEAGFSNNGQIIDLKEWSRQHGQLVHRLERYPDKIEVDGSTPSLPTITLALAEV